MLKRVVAILLLSTLLVWAQPPGPGPEPGQRGPRQGHRGQRMRGHHFSLEHLDRMREHLKLSDSQYESLKTLMVETRRTQIKKSGELELQKLELELLLREDRPDRAQVKQLFDQVAALKKELKWNQLEALLQLKETLTPEQRGKMRGKMPMMPRHR